MGAFGGGFRDGGTDGLQGGFWAKALAGSSSGGMRVPGLEHSIPSIVMEGLTIIHGSSPELMPDKLTNENPRLGCGPQGANQCFVVGPGKTIRPP